MQGYAVASRYEAPPCHSIASTRTALTCRRGAVPCPAAALLLLCIALLGRVLPCLSLSTRCSASQCRCEARRFDALPLHLYACRSDSVALCSDAILWQYFSMLFHGSASRRLAHLCQCVTELLHFHSGRCMPMRCLRCAVPFYATPLHRGAFPRRGKALPLLGSASPIRSLAPQSLCAVFLL